MIYDNHLAAVLQATSIVSATEYAWFGTAAGRLPRRVTATMDAAATRRHLVSELQSRLYRCYFCLGQPRPKAPPVVPDGGRGDAEFIWALSSANASTGSWEAHWRIRMCDAHRVVVHRAGLSLSVPRHECFPVRGGEVRVGMEVRVRLPKEQLGISPGFYLAQSNVPIAASDDEPLVRVYWHVSPEGAVRLMGRLTRDLNDMGLPFRFKVLSRPENYARCDAAVLYLRRADYESAAACLGDVYAHILPWLQPGRPALTKRLGVGAGLAEDPKDGGSFGWHRCRLLAEGIVRAHDDGVQSLRRRLQLVADHFTTAGLQPQAPFLNAGSRDAYHLLSANYTARRVGTSAVLVTGQVTASTRDYLPTAHGIAERIADTALWHGDRCTWLAPELEVNHTAASVPEGKRGVLGPSLYDGTSGIGWFLAEVAAKTQDSRLQRTALGAINQSLAKIARNGMTQRLGLYSGWPGVAWCVARVGTVLKDDHLVDTARQLARSCASHSVCLDHFDVISGLAGGILSLLAIAHMVKALDLVAAAQRLGDQLVDTAERTRYGCSWRGLEQQGGHNLTGYSHGAAGVAHALVELYAATGERKYEEFAKQAIAYEQHWFDSGVQNWPDFRQNNERQGSHVFMCAWCHGAAGIALSRMRAFRVLGDSELRCQAVAALETTRLAMRHTLATDGANWSLCHGLMGNAEVLHDGCELLGHRSQQTEKLVETVARTGLVRVAKQPRGFDGQQWEPAPGLMVGLAGTGYFYLRRGAPETPSILAMSPSGA